MPVWLRTRLRLVNVCPPTSRTPQHQGRRLELPGSCLYLLYRFLALAGDASESAPSRSTASPFRNCRVRSWQRPLRIHHPESKPSRRISFRPGGCVDDCRSRLGSLPRCRGEIFCDCGLRGGEQEESREYPVKGRDQLPLTELSVHANTPPGTGSEPMPSAPPVCHPAGSLTISLFENF